MWSYKSLPVSPTLGSDSCTCMGKLCDTCLIVAFVLLLGAPVPRQLHAQAASTSNSKISIHGVVSNSVTHEPIAHALVFSPTNHFATFTDEEGRFEFALPQPENGSLTTVDSVEVESSMSVYSGFPFLLTARKPGFLGSRNQNRRIMDFSLVTPGRDVNLTLIPEARILGRVVLPSSNAADRIPIQLYHRQIQQGRAYWNLVASMQVRASGEFRFADLEPGTYKVFTGELMDRDPLTFDPRGPVYGYPPAYFSNATDFQTATPIELSPGMTYQAELSPIRQPYHNVKISVSNPPADGQIDVKISVQGRKGPGFDLGYNPQNQTIGGSLPNGTYVIEASHQSPPASSGSVHLVVNSKPIDGPPLTLVPCSTVRINAKLEFKSNSDAESEIQGGGQISSRGSMQLGRFANVGLDPAEELSSPNVFLPSVSGHDDTLVLDGVAPGRYWIRVDSSRGYVAALTVGDVDLLRRPLTVGLGSNLVVDATLRDNGAEISGTVEGDSSYAPTPGVSVTAHFPGQWSANLYLIPLADSPGQFRQASIEPDGKFDVKEVSPGAYRVLAFDRPQLELEYTNSEVMRAYEGKGEVVRVAAGQKETVRLHLIATGE